MLATSQLKVSLMSFPNMVKSISDMPIATATICFIPTKRLGKSTAFQLIESYKTLPKQEKF